MNAQLREFIRRRAGDCCEYCRLPQRATPFISFHVEHIVARQHDDREPVDAPDNLALACDRCNAYKGPNLTSIDPATDELVTLFHPRRQVWGDHFSIHDGIIEGKTPAGRTTVRLLNMNAPRRVELRLEWLAENENG